MNRVLRLYTFGPMWGLPTAGPFGLKLETCFRMAGVDYERVIEDDLRKGPQRKSPWIEHDGRRIGDSTVILRHLGIDLEAGLDARQRAEGLALRRLLEEHWHQVLEYELFVDPLGRSAFAAHLRARAPRPLAWFVPRLLQRHFRRHLYERGLARHDTAEIQALAQADIEALGGWLGGRLWCVGEQPTLTDATLFGLLAPALWSTAATPAFMRLRAAPVLVDFCERMRARHFPEVAPSPPALLRRQALAGERTDAVVTS
jgi:glutathione S-transferase